LVLLEIFMRLLVNSLIAVMLVGVLLVGLLHYRSGSHQQRRLVAVEQAVAQIVQQIEYRTAVGADETNLAGFPWEIDPTWFDTELSLPKNNLAHIDQPWLDIAPDGDYAEHPPDPVIRSVQQAGLWYNPNVGIIRARVAVQFTQNQMLETYNQINGTTLTALDISRDPERIAAVLLPDPLAATETNRLAKKPDAAQPRLVVSQPKPPAASQRRSIRDAQTVE
jgi:hypothetical protein